MAVKPTAKKPKINRKRRNSNRQTVKTKNIGKYEQYNQTIKEENSNLIGGDIPKHFSRLTQTEGEWKIMKPCCSLLQNKKCSTEITCPYLHSDFPCKYYYLSLPCPQGHKCQFMHNGPLAPQLLEALRSHILDLLSSKPSCVETYFVQQMHEIDCIYQRLMNFQNNQCEESQIIEVLDDCDEDPILISDEGSNECNENASFETIPDTQVLDTSDEKLDMVYESFKETNALLEQIDGKLKNLKSTSNLTSNEKLVELQKIYELLKEKEKLLPIYENVNNCSQIPAIDNDLLLTAKESKCIVSNKSNDERNLVLVHPDIVNEIGAIKSEDNLITTTDDECGPETINKENLLQSDRGIEDTTILNNKTDSTDKNFIPGENRPESSTEIISSLHEIKEKHLENKTEVTENSCHSTVLNIDKEIMPADSKNCRTTQTISLRNIRETLINLSKDQASEAEKIDKATSDNITSFKHLEIQEFDDSSKRNRIHLRSHTQQELDISLNSLNSNETKEITKVKRRCLRLTKHNDQSLENTDIESRLKADVTDKPIQSEENNSDKSIKDPLTQNVVLSKRYLKKTKTNLQKQNIERINLNNSNNNDLDKTIEHNMFVLHNDVNTVENIDMPLLTQSSDDSAQSMNTSQECLIIVDDSDDNCKVTHLEDSLETQQESDKIVSSVRELKENQNLKREILFEHASSSTATTMVTPSFSSNFKQTFNLRNPHIVLTKLKMADFEQMERNKMRADSTTAYINSSNDTSSNLLSEDKTSQKRRSCSPEYDLESKYLKMDNVKEIWNPEEKNDDIDGFHANIEKLHVADATNSSMAENERQQALKPSLAHATVIETLQSGGPQYVVQQHENESDLHQQQIENVSNKSDLQLQSQQQGNRNLQQQKEVETEIITSSFIAKNIEPEQQREEETKSGKESEKQIAKTCNPYGSAEEYADGQEKSHTLQHPTEGQEEPVNISKEKYSNAPISPNVLRQEDEQQIEYEKYASLYNKLTAHTSKCQINFEDTSVNITPIASPTYGNDAIASPSPIKKPFDFHMTSEIDGRLTYPPIPYILYEIDLEKMDINKPQFIDKLKKTLSLDPRIFRSSVKKQTMTFHKPTAQISNALEPSTSTVVPYDPRIRSSAGALTVVESPLPTNQTALSCFSVHPMAMSSSVAALPLSLDYNTPQIVHPQEQQQQTPNMFLYGCLQRSPWYQSLMSTMKIQINQSISQLVRALNNFYRERLLNPLIVFDVFKIDCAGEILEIMRNLEIFIDSNGVINEQRQVPSFAGRTCCNNTPVNATYSFIQQVLTPNAHRTSMTTTSSTYNASSSGTMGSLSMAEPFVSCYIKPPESLQKPHLNGMTNSPYTDNNNHNCLCKKEDNYYNNGRNSSNQNERHYNQFKNKNNCNEHKGNNNNNYQQRSNQRSYNNNPRFSKTSEFQNRSSSSPPNSPKDSNNYDNGNSHNGGSYGAGRGRGGRFNYNNKKRFNNYNNNNGGPSWTSSNSSESDKCFNDKYHNNQSSYNSSNSPIRSSSPNTSYKQRSESPIGNSTISAPITAPKPSTNDDEEECWD